jgi:hypothetical protein
MDIDKIEQSAHPPRGQSRRPSTFAGQIGTSIRNHRRQDLRVPIINDMHGVGSVEKRWAVTAGSINRAERRQHDYHCHPNTDSFGNYEQC